MIKKVATAALVVLMLAGCPGPAEDPVTDTLDCEDFEFQDQAQAAYEAAKETNDEDPHNLDDDDDGIACEGELPDPQRAD